MLLRIDRHGSIPVYRQICDQIARLVDDETLRPAARLPASRVLAGRLGVNRSTVYRAYEELWAQGYLEARPGSYTVVRSRLRPPGPAASPAAGRINWGAICTPGSRLALEDYRRLSRPVPVGDGSSVIDFSSLAADRGLCPVEALRQSVRAVLSRPGREALDYGDAAGYRPLRETLARRMRVHGVSVAADEIFIANGAQHALDLVVSLLARPGATIAAESPTYSYALPLFRFHGLRVRGIPMRADGLDLDALAARLSRHPPALLYTIPNFHNPTGITTSQAHRERLLALCESRRVPVVEDGFEEELKYFGKAVLPIKSMDRSGIVVYLGTLSKVVFPGLRVGWVAAPRDCIGRLVAIHRCCALSGNQLAQAAVDHFYRAGSYEQYLRRVHRAYRSRMQAMLRGLRERLPSPAVEWTQPSGGYTLWVRVRSQPPRREAAMLAELGREGVRVAPGSHFFPGPPDGLCFRLSVANLDEARIEEGCRRLGRALARVVRSR